MNSQTIAEIRDALVPIATSVTLLSVAISSWLALRQYRLKLKSEKVANDIKLVGAFCDLLNIAHARSQTSYSEKFLDRLFEKDVLSKTDFEGLTRQEKIATGALTVPIGSAAQDAAIAALVTLGARHNVLKDASVQALTSLAESIPEKRSVISKHLLSAESSSIIYRFRKIKHWLIGYDTKTS